MCGRTACSLSKDNIVKACCYRGKNNIFTELQWQDYSNGGKTYMPSYNICPTDVTPVILLNSSGERVLQPMVWGMIPAWHKGNYNTHKLSTNNCRIEGIFDKKLYKTALARNQRCVVVCDGFYEWQTTKNTSIRQPYFIYAPQSEEISIDNPKSWLLNFSPESGWLGPRLLHMAAIYDSWLSPQGEKFASYSIITMESNDTFSWLHDRIPAILNSEEMISSWLDTGISSPKAVEHLTVSNAIKWHCVSTDVNKSTNKREGLNQAVEPISSLKTAKTSKSALLMATWLSGKSKRSNDDRDDSNKKIKL